MFQQPSCSNIDDNKLHIYLQLDRVSWENRTFLSKGGLRHIQHVIVEFEDVYWNLTAAVSTGDDGTIDNAFATDTDAQVLGPFNASDAGKVQRHVHYIVVVPRICSFFPDRTTPVRAQIIADGRDAACEPLINYLRLVLTIDNTDDTESPNAIVPPLAPLEDNFLLDRRHSILEQNFPVLNAALVSIHQNQIANELHTLFTVTQTANTDANACARRLAA